MKIITRIINGIGDEKLFNRVPVSRDTLKNGDVVIFNYSGKGERIAIVVKALPPKHKVKKSVWFCRNTSNTLVNVVKLNKILGLVIETISKELSKSNGLTAKQMKGLEAMVGRNSFRTYNLSVIRNLYKVYYI